MQTVFSSDVKFKGSWRPYQQRVIAEMDTLLDDRRLHVIAAPGSGKTVLGLEALLRLGRPALIISPTLAIRDQWIERFEELFLNNGNHRPDWISFDVRKPGLITSTTYQALHMAYAGVHGKEVEEDAQNEDAAEGEKETAVKVDKISAEALIGIFNKAKIETLVVDEAHHLRSEWWKTLTDVYQKLSNVKVVALTATPPCDVTYQEWQRYQDFCGPVDEEITVPELVLDNNLCPHQDYIYLSAPTVKENEQISAFLKEVTVFCQEILTDTSFIHALTNHPAILNTDQHTEEILGNPEYYSSIVIYLNHIKQPFPERILRVLGTGRNKMPPLTTDWLEILLTNTLYGDDGALPLQEDDQKRLRQKLSRIGVVDRRKIILKNTKALTKSLTQSMSKLESIVDIVRLESSVLKESLRLVVLSDFIRSEDLPSTTADCKPLDRLGVIPIFEGIRRADKLNVKIGCLCGTIIVIPKESEETLRRIAKEHDVSAKALTFAPLAVDDQYAEVRLEGAADEKAVMLITQLFMEGGITVLVGTKSLLGEGWDAPCINALILASFVGSFVLSNQMRGRAIRTCKKDPNKTANIWHLVCLQKSHNPLDSSGKIDLGPDWEMIQRRFKVFVGVSNLEPLIENGFDRLGIKIDGQTPISPTNETTKKLAQDRDGLRQKWEAALKRGADGVRMVEEIKAPQDAVPKNFLFQNTLRWLMVQGFFWGLFTFEHILPRGRNMDLKQILFATMIAGFISLAVALPFFIKSAWLYFKYGPVEGSVRQIGEAIFRSLTFFNLIKTDPAKIGVKTSTDKNGWVSCYLEGASSFEKSIFLDAFQEVLGALENPRYIITRNSTFLRFIRRDFHPVPEILAEKKERAEYFVKMWQKYVGPTDLIYTRTPEGRGILVRARGASLSGQFVKKAERLNAWK